MLGARHSPIVASRYVLTVVAILVLLGFIGTPEASVDRFMFIESQTTVGPPLVVLQNGTAGTSTIYTNTSAKASTPSLQILYTHQETLGFYYLLKLISADSAGDTYSLSAGTLGRDAWGSWVYRLTGVASIPASTWSLYYRAYTTSSDVVAHCDVDILIRMANGTVRQTVASDVANSSNLTTSWSTLSGTYAWTDYTVVDETDYLEIDFCVHVTVKKNNEFAYVRVDDSTLAQGDQTRAVDIYLPNTYDYVLRVNNTVTDSWEIRLKKYSDSNINRLENCTIYFRNSTNSNSTQIVIENGSFDQTEGPWFSLASLGTIYIVMTAQGNSTGTSNVYTYLEIRVPGTTTYRQYVIAFEIT